MNLVTITPIFYVLVGCLLISWFIKTAGNNYAENQKESFDPKNIKKVWLYFDNTKSHIK